MTDRHLKYNRKGVFSMKILVLYNVATEAKKGVSDDLICEKEIEIIVPLVIKLLSVRGYEVSSLKADLNLWENLRKCRKDVDLVFNLAEGFGGGNTNETVVPAILEALEIPFTGASAHNMNFTMDKEKTKLVLTSYGVPSVPHVLVREMSDLNTFFLSYPVIVKPVREEASIGITYSSVVSNECLLRRQVKELLFLYHQPVLVEQFIIGREISVGIVGNWPDLHIFSPLEFVFSNSTPVLRQFRSYEYKWGGGKENMVKAVLPRDMICKLVEYSRVAHIATQIEQEKKNILENLDSTHLCR